MTLFELRACVARQWTPQIGDPDVTGWLTVVAYALTALLAGLVWRRHARDAVRIFWAVLVGLLVFLAINKQLDLQTALTEAGKCLARAQGWYDGRRVVQVAFIGALLIVLAMAMGVLMAVLRGHLARHLGALVGLGLVLGFVMVRAVSIHGFDHLLGAQSLGVPNNFLFETSGLVLISANALWLLRRPRPQGGIRPG